MHIHMKSKNQSNETVDIPRGFKWKVLTGIFVLIVLTLRFPIQVFPYNQELSESKQSLPAGNIKKVTMTFILLR